MRYAVALCALVVALSTSALAAIEVDIDRNVNLAIGTRNFGPINVPNGLSVCTFTFDRTNWSNPSAVLRLWLETSIDGGSTWRDWFGFTERGGLFHKKRNSEEDDTEWSLTSELPPGTSRKVRGGYELSGSRFVSTVTVNCT